MLTGQDIVYIGNDWFTENRTSSHHIAGMLARSNRILYVEGAGQRSPQLSKRDFNKVILKIKKIANKPVTIKKNFYVFSPFILPFHKYGIIRKVNTVLIKLLIKQACKKVGFSHPLLWIFLPHYYSLAVTLKVKGVIYYCVDEYAAQPNVDSNAIRKMEKALLKKADVVFAVSDKLLKKKRKINPNTYLSPHGVNVDHFSKAMDKSVVLPEDIIMIDRPIIGFFGLIQRRIDLELIKFLASKRNAYSFVLIGLIAQDISMFEHYNNVHFLGPKSYDSLPQYLSAFDTAILPYCLNDEMIHSNPIKTKEYLAGGKPVVSVRIREIEKYNEIVYIADTYDEFLMSLDQAITEDSAFKRNARVKAMEKESWEYKLERISKIVGQHIII